MIAPMLTEMNLSGLLKINNKAYTAEGKKQWKDEKWKGKGIGAEGARMISEGLKSNSTLTELDLSGEGEHRKWKKIKRT